MIREGKIKKDIGILAQIRKDTKKIVLLTQIKASKKVNNELDVKIEKKDIFSLMKTLKTYKNPYIHIHIYMYTYLFTKNNQNNKKKRPNQIKDDGGEGADKAIHIYFL